MANTKVTTGVIKDDAVGADQLASNAVVTASITDNAITTAKISDNAILTAKISNSAITNAKMSANSVDSDQYVDASIDTAHIRDGQITSAKLDTNMAIGGTLTLGSHLIMGDNDIIKLGAGTDLQIYHDGSNSYIDDSGTGNLLVRADNLQFQRANGSQIYLAANTGAEVALYYAGAKKFETASGGVTVTGTITSTGRVTSAGITTTTGSVFEGGIEIGQTGTGTDAIVVAFTATNGNNVATFRSTDSGHGFKIQSQNSGYLSFNSAANLTLDAVGVIVLDADNGGQVQLKDGGTEYGRFFQDSNRLFIQSMVDDADILIRGKDGNSTFTALTLDMSEAGAATFNSSVGIGVTPSHPLHITKEIAGYQAYFNNDNGSAQGVKVRVKANDSGNFNMLELVSASSGSDVTAMVVRDDGNVGIGTTAPSYKLHLSGTIGDQAPLLLGTVTGTPPAAFNWVAEYMAANLAQDRRIVIALGKARSNNNAATISYVQRADANNNAIAFGHFGANDLVNFTSNGNVGIGTTTPAHLGLTGSGKVLMLDGDDCQVRLQNSILHHDNSGNTALHLRNHYTALGNDNAAKIKIESGTLVFGTSTSYTERMRLNSNGQLLIGPSFTSPVGSETVLQVSRNSADGGVVGFYDPDVSVSAGNVILRLAFTSDNDCTNGGFIHFADSGSTIGSVFAANASSVNFSTTSDERLKENIVDASSQLDLIKNIKVREFDWKKDGDHNVGMIAQELNTLIPYVVQEGTEDLAKHPWGIDYGKLTPYLIKAIQEQQTVIESLTARIEELEG